MVSVEPVVVVVVVGRTDNWFVSPVEGILLKLAAAVVVIVFVGQVEVLP